MKELNGTGADLSHLAFLLPFTTSIFILKLTTPRRSISQFSQETQPQLVKSLRRERHCRIVCGVRGHEKFSVNRDINRLHYQRLAVAAQHECVFRRQESPKISKPHNLCLHHRYTGLSGLRHHCLKEAGDVPSSRIANSHSLLRPTTLRTRCASLPTLTSTPFMRSARRLDLVFQRTSR